MGKFFTYKEIPFVADYGVQTCLEPVCLDIETSHKTVNGELITWISSIQVLWGKEYHLFSTAYELCEWYNFIISKYGFGYKEYKGTSYLRKLITYIHNAKFDLSYLIPFFKKCLPDLLDENGEPLKDEKGRLVVMGTLSLDEHEIIQYAQGALLFRCSYKLTNRSLENWGKTMNVKHKKKVGFYDYNKVRFPDEINQLTDKEKEYDMYDVLCLQECLKKHMMINNEALASYNGKKALPLTATGYPRRDLSENCLRSKSYMKLFYESKMTGEIYHACLCCYSGGYTHNNRFIAGQLVQIESNIKYRNKYRYVAAIGHRDFTSFYPSQLKKMLFPFGMWQVEYDINEDEIEMTLDEIVELYPRQTGIAWIRINKAYLRSLDITMPFMQECKLIYDKDDLVRKVVDNGRIIYLEFKEDKYADFYVDSVTLSILCEQYVIDSQTIKVWSCTNMPLPHEITDIIDKYFKGKSDKKIEWKKALKECGEMAEKTLTCATELALVKAWLNSLYGVFATRIVREQWNFDDKTLKFKLETPYDPEKDTKDEIAEKILQWEYEGVEHYYESNKSFIPFIVGVMTTSYARKQLYTVIKDCIGYDNAIYADTDSCYYISTPEIEKKLENYNALLRASAPSVELSNGEKAYYDYFDLEGNLRAFKGLHSKCYGYVNMQGEFKLIVAGVPARTIIGMNGDVPIYLTREEEISCFVNGKRVLENCDPIEALDKLSDGYTFYINTGLTAKYINYGEIRTFNIDGHIVHTAGGCVLLPAEQKEIKPFNVKEFINPDFKDEI